MSRPAEPLHATSNQDALSPTPAQVKKARMLVSMLGADFAKTSAHPFFKDLARTAVRPLDMKSEPADMSKALANLVRRLADARGPSAASTTKEVSGEPEPPQRDAPEKKEADIMEQHPALIAKHLIALPTPLQLDALRWLRGPTARQVAAYVAELKKELPD